VIGRQSVIDLKNNMLVIGDTTTPFLHESELPEYARLNSRLPGDVNLPGDVVSMDEDRQLAEALHRSANDVPVSSPRPGTYHDRLTPSVATAACPETAYLAPKIPQFQFSVVPTTKPRFPVRLPSQHYCPTDTDKAVPFVDSVRLSMYNAVIAR